MLDPLKPFARFPSDSLSRRIRRQIFRIGFFKRLQIAHERVVLGIRNLGLVQNVVEIFVSFRSRREACLFLLRWMRSRPLTPVFCSKVTLVRGEIRIEQ